MKDNEIKRVYNLDCRYDSRKSFYGKAVVEEVKDEMGVTMRLYSYGTLVASYIEYSEVGSKVFDWLGTWSQTTTRHQREFFKQLGLGEGDIKKLKEKGRLVYER